MSMTGGHIWPPPPPTEYLYWPFISLIKYFWPTKCKRWANGGSDGSIFHLFLPGTVWVSWQCCNFLSVIKPFLHDRTFYWLNAIVGLFTGAKRCNLFTVSPLASVVSVLVQCSCRACSCSETGSDPLHQNHSLFEFGGPATVSDCSTCWGKKKNILLFQFSRNGKLERLPACKRQLATVYWRRTGSFWSSPRLFIGDNGAGDGFFLPGPVHSAGMVACPVCLCIVAVKNNVIWLKKWSTRDHSVNIKGQLAVSQQAFVFYIVQTGLASWYWNFTVFHLQLLRFPGAVYLQVFFCLGVFHFCFWVSFLHSSACL